MHNDEGEVKVDKQQREKDDDEHSLSPILSTRYAYKAAKMTRTIGKNLLIIIGIVAAVLFFAIIDVLQETGYIALLPDDDITDIIIAALVGGSLAALVLAFWLLLRSRNRLDNWAGVFEQNAIRTGISIAMADKSKEEAVLAIAEVVEEVGHPLSKYIESKANFNEFIDVPADSIVENERLRSQQQEQKVSFDVLIDEIRVQNIGTATGDSMANDLKVTLKRYGGIVVKIVDGTIDEKSVRSFSKSISDHTSMSDKNKNKNKVGLALMIGDNITEDANRLVGSHGRINKEDHSIILIEKPRHILSDNNYTAVTSD
jgi:hypothetical protein